MKLETAQKLKWPWPCEMSINGIKCPSVEEMLERMPKEGIIIYKFRKTYMAEYKPQGSLMRYFMSETEDLSEATALLCIWLRDNNLMVLP